MAQVIDITRNPVATSRRVVRQHSAGQRTIARVDLSRPGATEELSELAADWLYKQCSDEGKRKLLEQRNLLAA